MISVTDPIQRAIDWTKKLLFGPFDFGKWCAIGFTAFLASFVSGGGGGGYRGRMPGSKGFGGAAHMPSPEDAFQAVWHWCLGHLALVGVLAVLALVVMVVFQWLGARGLFMFLDNVVHGRGEIAAPWTRFRVHANRVLAAILILDVAYLAVSAVAVWVGWSLARQDIADMEFGAHAIAGILAAAAILVPCLLVLGIVSLLLRDFVVPVMYLRNCTVGEGFGILRRELLAGRGGSFVLFYLMKAVLFLAAAVVIMFGVCITCCTAGLPYVSSVVFLPVFVFFRAYSLEFMAQCGAEWRILPEGSGH